MNLKSKGKAFFQVFLQIYECFLNPQTAKDECIRFRSVIWFLQFPSHLQKLGTYSFGSTLNLLSSLCAYTFQFVFPKLLKSAHKYWYYLFQRNCQCYYYYTTATTTNNKVNANSGPRQVIQVIGQGCKYKYKLRRQGWYMQTQGPDW